MAEISISRRDFIRASGLTAAWAALSACGPVGTALLPEIGGEAPAGGGDKPVEGGDAPAAAEGDSVAASDPTATPWPAPAVDDDALLVHTVRRMSYGMSAAMLARARDIGLDAYIEEQLNPEAVDDSQVEQMLDQFEVLKRSPSELIEQPEERGRQAIEFILATLVRQRFSERQFYELVVDFWTNHFNIFIGDGPTGLLKVIDDREVIRPYALATFPELLTASAHSPAMLTYLDQAASRNDRPNENYARELLELHTVGVDGGYTQSDVEEAARALTGWSVVRPRERGQGGEPLTFKYRAQVHDDGEKRIMDLTLPAGGGKSDGDRLLEYLSAHSSTARYVSRKMATRFVADTPPQNLVDAMAETFTSTGGDVKSMLRTMLASSEFAASAGQKVKRPLEFFISALRATDAQVAGRPGIIRHILGAMGHWPYGWSTPDGYPDYAAWWTTTSGLLNRWNFALLLMTGGLPSFEVQSAGLTRDAGSPEDVVDILSLQFLGETLPDDARSILVDFASTGDLGQNVPLVGALILGSPHFQVR